MIVIIITIIVVAVVEIIIRQVGLTKTFAEKKLTLTKPAPNFRERHI